MVFCDELLDIILNRAEELNNQDDPFVFALRSEIIKVLKELSANVGIFISDHNFRDVINVCDEIILLNQGEVLLKGNPKDVKNDPLAKKFYFGDLN